MAKREVRGREPNREPSETTRAARAAMRSGPVVGRRYIPKADEAEEAAFASASPERVGQRGRTAPEAIAAARSRMRGPAKDDPPPVRGFGDDFTVGEAVAEAKDAIAEAEDLMAEDARTALVPKNVAFRIETSRGGQSASFSPFAHPAFVGDDNDAGVVQSTKHAKFTARRIAAEDIDRLWDWIRADDGTFLNRRFATSPQLHQLLFQLGVSEASGLAIVRSLVWDGRHFGFLLLSPILATEQTALLHVYLERDAQGSLDVMMPAIVEIATALVPDVHLAIYAEGTIAVAVREKTFASLGFGKHTMFIR